MATVLSSASIRAVFNATLANDRQAGNAGDVIGRSPVSSYANGNAADQAEESFSERRTLTSGGSYEYTLSALENGLGETINYNRITGFHFENLSEVHTLEIGGALAQALASLFGSVTDILVMRPATPTNPSFITINGPDAVGYGTAIGVTDKLLITNGGEDPADGDFVIALLGSVS
jgi:hypothetical protein